MLGTCIAAGIAGVVQGWVSEARGVREQGGRRGGRAKGTVRKFVKIKKNDPPPYSS